jgi:hypothetical protein
MSIVARPPDPDPPRGSRTGDGTPIGTLSLPPAAVLLPSAGTPSPVPAPTPRRALALDALQFLRQVRGSLAADATWADAAFRREVELVRGHLEPIRSRDGLAASFEREAFQVRRPVLTPDGGPTGPLSPVRLAYAIRWLELGDGDAGSAWTRTPASRGRSRAGRAEPRRRPPGIARGRR